MSNRSEAISEVLSVLRDGGRSDRYLRVSGDGSYYTTPDLTNLTAEGRETPPYVRIPVAESTSESDEEEWAEALVAELDEMAGD